MKETILNKIKKLPPLPDTIIEIEKIYQENPDNIFDLIAKILEKDPILTAHIIKEANSPLYGLRNEVKTINQAISLFGMATIRGFVLSTILKNNTKANLSPYNLTSTQFLELAKIKQAIAFNWLKKINVKLAGEVGTMAFLVEIGKVVLSEYFNEENKGDVLKEKLFSIEELLSEEKFLTETTSIELSSEIFKKWNFNKNFVDIIKYSENPKEAPVELELMAKMLYIINIAIPVSREITTENLKVALEKIEEFKLNKDSFLTAIQIVKENV